MNEKSNFEKVKKSTTRVAFKSVIFFQVLRLYKREIRKLALASYKTVHDPRGILITKDFLFKSSFFRFVSYLVARVASCIRRGVKIYERPRFPFEVS